MIKCKKCGIEKNKSEFSIYKGTIYFRHSCKKCEYECVKNRRKSKPPPQNLCKCGCGKLCYNLYVNGHNSNNYKKQTSGLKLCRKCNRKLEITNNFYYNKSGYYNGRCKECERQSSRIRSYERYNKSNYEARKKHAEAAIRVNRKLRYRVLIHYGGFPPKCACCDEWRLELLCIDHIHNNGKEHRNKVGTGANLWKDIINNNFPENQYQVLCHNCNIAKEFYTTCPHKYNVTINDVINTINDTLQDKRQLPRRRNATII